MTETAAAAERAAAAAPAPGAEPQFTAVQSLMWPEQGICTERDLYVRLQGAAGFSENREGRGPVVHFAEGARAGFDTWFNLFNIGKWREHCTPGRLRLRLEGAGEFAVSVILAMPHRSWERVLSEVVALEEGGPGTVLDLGHVSELDFDKGLLFFELMSLGKGRLTDAHWEISAPPLRRPELMLSITTFRREAAVEHTVQRFERFIAGSPLKGHIRLCVVDNGRSAEIAESPHVRLIGNENLGGAGGFSRGLLAARDSGASHCLFMDDDASVHMASLERTWMFLAYASDPATAVAGAMINATHRWAIWENGARFYARCMPLYMGTDLRDPGQTIGMEFDTTGPAPENFYGGWWYFAFPVAHASRQPFPFFVRGDDVSFSLVHDFNLVTLNGVVSFQDSFTDKESPLTWYLDLRSHMAHHLSLPALEAGRFGVLKIAVWFFLRNLPRMHYETLTAISMALEDVMRGPGFFDEHADMARRRSEIKALTRTEVWRKAPRGTVVNKWRINPRNRLWLWLMRATLNGHLVPFFSRLGNRVTLEAQDRGSLRWVWGASEITYLSADRRQCYTVRHSKARLARESWRFLRAALRFLADYDGLLKRWRKGYDDLTGESYWRRKLRLDGQAPAGPETP